MDFEYTPEQIHLRKSVREFAEAEIAPHVMEWDEAQTFPLDVIRKLGKLGYIETIRGRNGGIRLARNPADICIGEVVRQTEEDFFLVECFDREHNCCVITPVCNLRSALHEALEAFLSVLDRYTLADLSSNKALYQQLITITTSVHSRRLPPAK